MRVVHECRQPGCNGSHSRIEMASLDDCGPNIERKLWVKYGPAPCSVCGEDCRSPMPEWQDCGACGYALTKEERREAISAAGSSSAACPNCSGPVMLLPTDADFGDGPAPEPPEWVEVNGVWRQL